MTKLLASLASLVFLIAAIHITGCNRNGPIESVKGKVVITDRPNVLPRLVGGKVRIQSTSNPPIEASGIVDDDGSFSVSVYKDGKSESVPPGEYRVVVEPPLDEEKKFRTGIVHSKFTEFGSTTLIITVPSRGPLVLEVESPFKKKN